jgi:cardiolipin synthase
MSFRSSFPNFLTTFRVFASILMAFIYYLNVPYNHEILFFIFMISSISDFFDGYLSRKWNVVSNFGTCLDPISDKLLLVISLLILVHSENMNVIIASILVSREIIISGLREFLAQSEVKLPVSRLAKWKTAFQLVGISMCFFASTTIFKEFFHNYLHIFPLSFVLDNLEISTNFVLFLAVYTTLHTGFLYIWNSRKYF